MNLVPAMSTEEIANELGIPVSAVLYYERKALAKLQRYMERHLPGLEPDDLIETIGHSSVITPMKTPQHQ